MGIDREFGAKPDDHANVTVEAPSDGPPRNLLMEDQAGRFGRCELTDEEVRITVTLATKNECYHTNSDEVKY